jgi:cell division protein FtsB
MFDFHQKRKLKAAFESRITWTIILVLSGFMIVSAYNRYQIARDMAERRLDVESEKQRLLERQQELEADVEYLSNERGIEAEMRRQFDVAREGEQVVIIVPDDTTEIQPLEVSTTTPSERPWYRFW